MRVVTVPLLCLFLVVTIHQYIKDPSRITLLIFAFAEVLTVVLAAFSRVPRERDWNPLSVVVTVLATFYFLAFQITPGTRLVPEAMAATIQVIGVVVQIYSKWSLRRAFGLLPANRGIIVTGSYRFVRHPMYLGYLVTDIGFLAANFGTRNLVVVLVQWTLQVQRIVREERLLSNDIAYREYKRHVRYRLLYGVF
ncbi:isoprenylcysteine carboxylmethyltransferase family protein [Paraburkholderia sp. SARCC-3016]|uniref:methyltransferase family protein n=1 Tax=Paraburkholderia sp. SARCC-3016 TaxID=3058611 RepID=UPI0028099BB7|nr:isoprenylcysteine carboxylmethyltransferase family protein [Paraburkholderia sp. SARCC-3016]MDQ7981736.1 isoprenylcysteine carboxylmethyltransferase family protein [Paraburkholderia sp. SARCC-3016]